MAAEQSTPASKVQLAYNTYRSAGYMEPLAIVRPLIDMDAKRPTLADTTEQLMDSAQTSMDALYGIMEKCKDARMEHSPSHFEFKIKDMWNTYGDTVQSVEYRIANTEDKMAAQRQEHVKANDELQTLQQQMATLQSKRVAHQQDYENTEQTYESSSDEEDYLPPSKAPRWATGGVSKRFQRLYAISQAMERIDNEMEDIKNAIDKQERKCNTLVELIKTMDEHKKDDIERRDYLRDKVDVWKQQIAKMQQPEAQQLRDALARAHDKLTCIYGIRKAQQEIARLQEKLCKHDQDGEVMTMFGVS